MGNWYRLDHVGNIYPAVMTRENTVVFRVSMILTERVNRIKLQEALDITIKRFPRLAAALRKGIFWNYLYENNNRLLVQEESAYPCAFFDGYANNGFMLRVLYFNKRISLEIFHGLTDGFGTMEFLKTLVYSYLRLAGKDVRDEGMVILPESEPDILEEEDSYYKYSQESKKEKFNLKEAYAINGCIFKPYGINVTHGIIAAPSLNRYARELGATMTGYVASVLIKAIFDSSKQRRINEPITLCIPVNLRNIFPSKTLKNFVTVVYLSIYVSPKMKLVDIVEEVAKQIKEIITKDRLAAAIATTVSWEKIPGLRFVPLFLKDLVIKNVYWRFDKRITMSFTNLGAIKLPISMQAQIEMMESVIYPKGNGSVGCSMCSVNDRLNISFARNIIESDIINRFFELISEDTGLEIEVYTNNWGERVEGQDRITSEMNKLYPTYNYEGSGLIKKDRGIKGSFGEWKAKIHV